MRSICQFPALKIGMLFSLSVFACLHYLHAEIPPVGGADSPIVKPGSKETRKIAPSIKQGTGAAPAFFDGRWGSLGIRELTLEAPDAHMVLFDELKTWKSGTKWEFHHDIATVVQILRDSGLNENTITALTTPPHVEYQIGKTIIFPPKEIILALTPQMRSRLYPQIGVPDRSNGFMNASPLISGGFRRLTEIPSGLSTETINLIDHLIYSKKGGGLYFSDMKFVLSMAADDQERIRVIKTLGREISLHAWLRLSETSDRESIINYWSAGERNQAGRIALEAILENPGISRLDLVHILPPLPKRMINTYPDREEGLGAGLPDCFATAFSFFSNSLPPRIMDSESVSKMHDERYERATAPWQFGDVLMIQSPDGRWIHACNFVAGEVVFTKNGQSHNRPWVFQTMNEVLSTYLVDERIQAFFFRLKPGFRE